MSLSVCIIVKNEERVLGRCLSAAVQFADELIVVDTGSADRSVEIAREYTGLVFREPWQDSFARARNFAASKAGCDHVMWLDADDIPDPDGIRRLLELRDRLTPETDAVFMTYRNDGFPADFGLRDRIHRRALACRWEGDIHEAIRIDSSWNILLCPEITIIHKKEYVNEPERNMRIFDGVRDSGRLSGYYMLSYYCRELALRDDPRAAEAWRDLLAADPPAARVQYALVFMAEMLLRQKEYEKCRQVITASVERYGVPLSAFLCYQLGLAAEGLGEAGEAQRQYRKATEIPPDASKFTLEFAGYNDYLPCLKLCALAYDEGKTEESEVWNSRAGKAWPEGRSWRINRERFFSPPVPPGRNPLVSVVMPVRNAGDFLAGAVSSILEQSWRNLELVIVDDGSAGAVCDAVRGFSDPRIRLLENSRPGTAAAVNLAIAESRGEYIALMDADGVSLPERLEAQLAFLENNREVMILGTASQLIDREGEIIACSAAFPGSPEHFRAKLLLESPEFCASSVMIRKSFIADSNLAYREEYDPLQDFRFLMEASKLGAISCLADTHCRCRYPGGQVSETDPAQRAAAFNRIRCDSLRMSGAGLGPGEEALLGRLLPEEELPLWNRQERQQLAALFAGIRERLAAAGFPAMRELETLTFSILNH